MKNMEYYKKSEDWVRSFGIGMTKIHFRQKDGTGHAVCERDGGCSVHYDSYNPHNNFFAHIWEDSPEVIWRGLLFTTATILAPTLFSKLREMVGGS